MFDVYNKTKNSQIKKERRTVSAFGKRDRLSRYRRQKKVEKKKFNNFQKQKLIL